MGLCGYKVLFCVLLLVQMQPCSVCFHLAASSDVPIDVGAGLAVQCEGVVGETHSFLSVVLMYLYCLTTFTAM